LTQVVGLLRHGQVDGIDCFRGSTNTVLSQSGTQQMWQTMASYSQWCKILSSPLARCAEFARQYGEKHALPVEIVPSFREIDFGAWEGRSSEEIYAEDPTALSRFWQAPLTNTPPQGEPLACFQARVISAWNGVVAGDRENPILVITHAGVIRIILSHLLNRPVEKLLELSVPHASLHNVTLSTQDATIHCHVSEQPAYE